MKDKRGGGMGVRNLRMHNKSLLFKWLWILNEDKVEIWKKVTITKHGKLDCWQLALYQLHKGAQSEEIFASSGKSINSR